MILCFITNIYIVQGVLKKQCLKFPLLFFILWDNRRNKLIVIYVIGKDVSCPNIIIILTNICNSNTKFIGIIFSLWNQNERMFIKHKTTFNITNLTEFICMKVWSQDTSTLNNHAKSVQLAKIYELQRT